jgi:hypothetical protein
MKALLFSYLILSPFVLIAYLVEDFPIAATSILGFGFLLVVVYLIFRKDDKDQRGIN